MDNQTKAEALERLLAHPGFRVSQRNKNFLRFVVEESLAGRSSRIKAYTVAVEVFGRGTNFDGMLDPVVRIEAGRLRQALTSYYVEDGRADPIRISLPRGGYMPVFERVGGATVPAEAEQPAIPAETEAPDVVDEARPATASGIAQKHPPTKWPRHWKAVGLSTLAVLALVGFAAMRKMPDGRDILPPLVATAQVQPLSDNSSAIALARTLSQSLPAAISRFDGLTVVAARPDQTDQDLIGSLTAREPPSRRIYVVLASIGADSQGALARWQLTDGRNQSILWSGTAATSFARNTEASPEDDIAQTIANAIASRQGLLSSFAWKAIPVPPPPGYACVARARSYSTTLTDSLRKELTFCLERTVAQNPGDADAWALLGYVHADENRVRGAEPEAAKAALAKAESAAAKAEALAPYAALTQETASVVAFQAGDIPRFEAAGRKAMAINPGNPGSKIIFANRLFFAGKYDESIALLREAIPLRARPVATDQLTLILDLYRRSDYPAALAMVKGISMPNFYIYWLLLAAIQGELGESQAASEAVAQLLKLRPDYSAAMRSDFRNRRFQPDFIEHLAEGLRKAGMQIK
ncbi:hypothetical protein DWF00_04305 [Bosea caraganae]|uniref:Tetratricopeptide repeat protein n=2 Tax=Bosea caraganae TaxID=2763117 RepID=A0A370KXU9_9HYPH|nr:hypothetical protein [Bosea caraganae]RDJ19824.1 hypothetical protein DWE98_27815 [Bosea caraganae]RDJ30035.1 hypothetical protein DWF00_04305 [Bosea caraganae]